MAYSQPVPEPAPGQQKTGADRLLQGGITPTPPPVVSTVGRILETGQLRVGVKSDSCPFSCRNETTGEFKGIEIELAREFADRWSEATGTTIEPEFVEVTSVEDRVTKVVSLTVDLAAGITTHRRERDELIDFSQPYYVDGQSLLVKASSGISQVADLKDRRVAVITATGSLTNLLTEAARQNIQITLAEFTDKNEAVEALQEASSDDEEEEIVAFSADKAVLAEFAKNDLTLVVIDLVRRQRQAVMSLWHPDLAW